MTCEVSISIISLPYICRTMALQGEAAGPRSHRGPARPQTPTLVIFTTAQAGPLEGRKMLPSSVCLIFPSSFQSPPQRRLQPPPTPQAPVTLLKC